ncbi:MAG: hypothetical protein A2Y65_00895 [Deltaproteobacteria bacterium RBG_13_52_11]|nr:MAG: hypothetical protein A2Y65_00895 [Deltaproteobacteria bacterium RBG_13_52_11]
MNQEEDDLFEKIPSEEEDKDTGVPIYKINSYPSDPTLELLYTRWKREEINIPDFQRGWVWKPTQASRLVESFLLGLPVPSIFVYKEPSQRQLVIDGQQRLRTIWGFFEGKLPDGTNFYLRGVSPEWEGKYYHTLSESDQIRFRDSVLRQVIVEQTDPKDTTSIYHIYERLNTGGTGLVPQEIRNSTYHGPFNDLLLELNKNPMWRAIFGKSQPDSRMRDVELIVRFFALFDDSYPYTKPMKQFLNTFMGLHQQDISRDPYETVFLTTIKKVHDSLGKKPFHVKRGINVAAFDSVMVAFARSTLVPSDVSLRYEQLKANPSYAETISSATTDELSVRRRIQLAQEILFK